VERLATTLGDLLKRLTASSTGNEPTSGVDDAARLLKTTRGGIYAMHARGLSGTSPRLSDADGVWTPIPTRPLVSIRTRSVLAVLITSGWLSAVPRKSVGGLVVELPLVTHGPDAMVSAPYCYRTCGKSAVDAGDFVSPFPVESRCCAEETGGAEVARSSSRTMMAPADTQHGFPQGGCLRL
jgi:hypothetical protein